MVLGEGLLRQPVDLDQESDEELEAPEDGAGRSNEEVFAPHAQ